MHYHVISENERNFIISSLPLDNELDEYVTLLKNNSINLVINLTDLISYTPEKIQNANIDYLNFPLKDGSVPSDEQIKKFMIFLERYNSIAFHCVAGFGRAPLLLAITLILLYNYKPLHVIEKIRELNPKAFNTMQIHYLCKFKRKKYIDKKCIIN
jgi:protein tyrosine phosphatase type 4A